MNKKQIKVLTELIQRWKTEADERNVKGNLIRKVCAMCCCISEIASNELEMEAKKQFNREDVFRRCASELDDLIKGVPPEK